MLDSKYLKLQIHVCAYEFDVEACNVPVGGGIGLVDLEIDDLDLLTLVSKSLNHSRIGILDWPRY